MSTYAEQMADVLGDDDTIEKGGKRGDLKINKEPFPHKKRTGPATTRPGKGIPAKPPIPKQLKPGMKKGEGNEEQDDVEEPTEQGGELETPEGAVEKGAGMCKGCKKPKAMCKCADVMKKSVPATLGAAVMYDSLHGMTDDDLAKAVQSGELGVGGTVAGLGRRG